MFLLVIDVTTQLSFTQAAVINGVAFRGCPFLVATCTIFLKLKAILCIFLQQLNYLLLIVALKLVPLADEGQQLMTKHSQPIFDLAFQVDNLSNIPKIVAANTHAL